LTIRTANGEIHIAPRLTPREVSELLHVPTKTVLNLARRGDIPRHKIRKTVRFDPADIVEYLEKTKAAGQVEENGNDLEDSQDD